ncbi:MAG: hypothetical protein QOH93_474 [Chloroflexia bacterium]|nr:hypothetical protein [Chloroflexia bacterium]
MSELTLIERAKAILDILDAYTQDVKIFPRLIVPSGIDREAMKQFAHRAIVRTVYSHIEAMAYLMKQVSLAPELSPEDLFSSAELALLREDEYFLDGNGKAQRRSARISTLNNLRFSFDTFARATKITSRLPVHEHGWQFIKEGNDIRDRITHPKQPSDLFISDEQLGRVLDGHTWFINNLVPCLVEAFHSILPKP